MEKGLKSWSDWDSERQRYEDVCTSQLEASNGTSTCREKGKVAPSK